MTQFKNMPAHSRAWIYQSSKEFTENDKKIFHELSETFLENWISHNKPVKGTIELFHSQFVVVLIDDLDDKVCGGSIDASQRLMKELEQELNVTLLDRMLAAYRKDGKIISLPLHEFRILVESGVLNENTIVFNNLVSTKEEFENNWEVPLKRSWHKQLIA
ncbi:MAG: ABC transporter ATPase [Bacteroidetes bacterium]|nr:ABC transporter ATPase [Bacteroidota bacterium]